MFVQLPPPLFCHLGWPFEKKVRYALKLVTAFFGCTIGQSNCQGRTTSLKAVASTTAFLFYEAVQNHS